MAAGEASETLLCSPGYYWDLSMSERQTHGRQLLWLLAFHQFGLMIVDTEFCRAKVGRRKFDCDPKQVEILMVLGVQRVSGDLPQASLIYRGV